jgi:hypothetical protein
VFALGFALEQMHRNFVDLQRCVQDYARRPREEEGVTALTDESAPPHWSTSSARGQDRRN